MPSPFPGMDPYLEQHWGDVHHRLITYASDQLQERLPGGLRARVEERIFVESERGNGRSVYPDIRVVEHRRRAATSPPPAGGLAVAEPLVIHFPDEPMTQGYIEILEVGSGNRVITVVEVLSPSNKLPGEGQDLYLRKRSELKQGGASLVEIDLVRTGRRILTLAPEEIPPSHRTTYQICVSRGGKPGEAEVYRAPLRERLPTIKVPLREADADVPLELQALIEQCYRNGRYEEDIDYRVEPVPPFDAADAKWADELLRSKRLR
jgi:Protein of unknown function (DUF4058)